MNLVEGVDLGHEILCYRDRHAILHDHDLWAIRHFVLLEAQTLGFEELVEFMEGWNRVGPGVWLATELDTYLGENRRKEEQLIVAIRMAEVRLKNFGSHVPLEYLEQNLNLTGFAFAAPQSVDNWVDNLRKIEALIPTGD